MHKLLERQLKRHIGSVDSIPKKWKSFLEVVNEAYHQTDTDRVLLERSLDLTSEELFEKNQQLQQQVAVEQKRAADLQRTQEILAKRASELELVAQVGTAALTSLNTSELLQKAVDLTKEGFSLYHVHIYLFDEISNSLILASGAGEVGRLMVSEHWSIPFEREQSLVARAARNRRGVIINDVRQAPDWLPNPLLPDTRSELAVPLIAGDRLLGVLDVQSDQVDYFSADDIRIQKTLAAQVAVALENARLFEQAQKADFLLRERVKELDCLNDIGREMEENPPPLPELLSWITERIPPAMRYPHLTMVAIEFDGQVYGQAEAIALPAQIVHGLYIGGEILGRIYIAYTEKHDFIDEESALLGGIATRLSSFIENQRLLEQMQQRATELEETTSFLNSVLENMPAGLFVKEAEELRFVRWNKASQEIYGLTEKEVLGKSDYDFFTKKEADFSVTKDRQVLTSSQMLDIPEEPVRTPHQGLRFLHTRKVPVMGPDGKPRYLLGISEDITERKQVQEALAKRARELGCLNDIGREMEESPPPLPELLRWIADRIPPAMQYPDLAMVAIEFDGQVYGQAEAITLPTQIVHGLYIGGEILGRIYIAYTEKHDFLDEESALLGGIATRLSSFIENQRLLAQAQQRSLEMEQVLADIRRLAAIVENHPDFIGVGSLDGKTLYVNPAGLRMMGLPASYDVTSMEASDFYPVEDAERLVKEGVPTALEKGSWASEASLLRADGTMVSVEQTVSINYDLEGNPASFSITMHDITNRKVAAAQQERLLTEVEAAYRQYVRQEWEQYLQEQHQNRWHIEYKQAEIEKSAQDWLTEIQEKVLREGKTEVANSPTNGDSVEADHHTAAIVTPISLRGQVIGTLNLQDLAPDRNWTAEEVALVEAVSEQLALTVENLRLFDDTQRRATREQLTHQITDKMRVAPDVDSIIQTGLTELAKTLGVSRTYVKLSPSLKSDQQEP
ncbi:MAG: GAF domain-containing protein [Anaerolineae bacterium]|nr:GAF domain-containing protein [Anaerolineae bacterium]